MAVLLVGQIVAVGGALVVALLVGARVGLSDLALGAAAGVANMVGLGFLYQGLARARIGVVAPITAVMGAIVPVGWALVKGERPSSVVLIGAGCAIVAGALIARERTEVDTERPVAAGVGYAIAAGTALGASLVLFSETSHASGFWPVAASRISGLIAVALVFVVLARRKPIPLPQGVGRRLAVGAGALDVTATTVLLAAVRHGLLVVVAPVAALAPAFTVMWAWIVLREPVSRTQLVGLTLALVGLVLVSVG